MPAENENNTQELHDLGQSLRLDNMLDNTEAEKSRTAPFPVALYGLISPARPGPVLDDYLPRAKALSLSLQLSASGDAGRLVMAITPSRDHRYGSQPKCPVFV
jgi:hypothetical protein